MSDLSTLLERFRRGPEVLAMVLTGVFGEEEDFTTAPGKWSIRQIIAHLADAKLVTALRLGEKVDNFPHAALVLTGGIQPGDH